MAVSIMETAGRFVETLREGCDRIRTINDERGRTDLGNERCVPTRISRRWHAAKWMPTWIWGANPLDLRTLPGGPSTGPGEQVAWGESNAVAFVNWSGCADGTLWRSPGHLLRRCRSRAVRGPASRRGPVG